MKEDINNIHDKFVRASFSDPERAAASFQTILPVELVNQIKWITYFFWGLTHKKSKDQQLVNRFIAFFHDKNM